MAEAGEPTERNTPLNWTMLVGATLWSLIVTSVFLRFGSCGKTILANPLIALLAMG